MYKFYHQSAKRQTIRRRKGDYITKTHMGHDNDPLIRQKTHNIRSVYHDAGKWPTINRCDSDSGPIYVGVMRRIRLLLTSLSLLLSIATSFLFLSILRRIASATFAWGPAGACTCRRAESPSLSCVVSTLFSAPVTGSAAGAFTVGPWSTAFTDISWGSPSGAA